MIISLQCNSHYLTCCHKKSRLLFALNFSTTSGDCTLTHVFPIIHMSIKLLLHSHLFYCTVTCRQFLNLTFAPRKTLTIVRQPHASQLSMSQQLQVYIIFQSLASLFFKKAPKKMPKLFHFQKDSYTECTTIFFLS